MDKETVIEDELKEETEPIEVKITNKPEKPIPTEYDDHDADEYDEHIMTQKEIEDFENGNT